MDKKELASKLNGREYGNEITKEEEKIAEERGLVVVFGASDDLMEFRGTIYDEVGCYNGGTAYLTPDWMKGKTLLQNKCDSDNCPCFKKEKERALKVHAHWNKGGYSWLIELEGLLSYEVFDIMEEGEKYCRGIVFQLIMTNNA